MALAPGTQFVDSGDSRIIVSIPPDAIIPQPSTRVSNWLNGTTYFQDTIRIVTVPGTSLQLSFYGREVEVFGVTFPLNGTIEPPQAVYTVEDTTVTADVPTTLDKATADIGFFRIDSLPLAYHLLTINVTNASGDAPYLLDYIAFDAYDVFPTPSPNPSASATTPPSSSPSETSSTASLGSTETTVASGQHSISTGISVGVALGGAALLLVVFAASFWFWTRSGRSRASPLEDAERKELPPTAPQMTSFAPSATVPPNAPITPDACAAIDIGGSRGHQLRVSEDQRSIADAHLRPAIASFSKSTPNLLPLDLDSQSARSSAMVQSTSAPRPSVEGSSTIREFTVPGGVVSFDGKESRLDPSGARLEAGTGSAEQSDAAGGSEAISPGPSPPAYAP